MTIVVDRQAYERALKLAKGAYQRNIILGIETLSGSSLSGSAAQFSNKYRASRQTLFGRLRDEGVPHCVVTGGKGNRWLLFGAMPQTGLLVVDRETNPVLGLTLPALFRHLCLVDTHFFGLVTMHGWAKEHLGGQGARWMPEHGFVLGFSDAAALTQFYLAHVEREPP